MSPRQGTQPSATAGGKSHRVREKPMKNQTFGIELEMNGILRTKAAQVIAEHFGTHPSQPEYGCYHTQTIRMPDGRVWKVISFARYRATALYSSGVTSRVIGNPSLTRGFSGV